MRTSILVLACAVIGFLPPAAWFTFRYQQVKVSFTSFAYVTYIVLHTAKKHVRMECSGSHDSISDPSCLSMPRFISARRMCACLYADSLQIDPNYSVRISLLSANECRAQCDEPEHMYCVNALMSFTLKLKAKSCVCEWLVFILVLALVNAMLSICEKIATQRGGGEPNITMYCHCVTTLCDRRSQV